MKGMSVEVKRIDWLSYPTENLKIRIIEGCSLV